MTCLAPPDVGIYRECIHDGRPIPNSGTDVLTLAYDAEEKFFMYQNTWSLKYPFSDMSAKTGDGKSTRTKMIYCKNRNSGKGDGSGSGDRMSLHNEVPCGAAMELTEHYSDKSPTPSKPVFYTYTPEAHDENHLPGSLHNHSLKSMDLRPHQTNTAVAVLVNQLMQQSAYRNHPSKLVREIFEGHDRDLWAAAGAGGMTANRCTSCKNLTAKDSKTNPLLMGKTVKTVQRGNAELQMQDALEQLKEMKDPEDKKTLKHTKFEVEYWDKDLKKLVTVCGIVWQSQWQSDIMNMGCGVGTGRVGELFLYDATHKTTELSWYLFTVLVRDGFGTWIPAGHMLLQRQVAVAISASLEVLCEWNPNWRPLYAITDDSAAEQAGIRDTFNVPRSQVPDAAFAHDDEDNDNEEEQAPRPAVVELDHALDLFGREPRNSHAPKIIQYRCQRHQKETLLRNISLKKYKPVINQVLRGMYMARSREEVERHVNSAANMMEYDYNKPGKAKYLRDNWLHDIEKWATYARLKSPLLLQIRTTSPLEGYHNGLKCRDDNKQRMPTWSLIGTIIACIMQDATHWRKAVAFAEQQHLKSHFWKKKGGVECAPFKDLPQAAQQAMREQINECDNDHRHNVKMWESYAASTDDQPSLCSCLFFHQHHLPCKHIWRDHLYHGTRMTAAHVRIYTTHYPGLSANTVPQYWWDRKLPTLILEGFEETPQEVAGDVITLIVAAAFTREQYKQVTEDLNQTWYAFKNNDAHLPEDESKWALNWFTRISKDYLTVLSQMTVQDWIKNGRQRITESDFTPINPRFGAPQPQGSPSRQPRPRASTAQQAAPIQATSSQQSYARPQIASTGNLPHPPRYQLPQTTRNVAPFPAPLTPASHHTTLTSGTRQSAESSSVSLTSASQYNTSMQGTRQSADPYRHSRQGTEPPAGFSQHPQLPPIAPPNFHVAYDQVPPATPVVHDTADPFGVQWSSRDMQRDLMPPIAPPNFHIAANPDRPATPVVYEPADTLSAQWPPQHLLPQYPQQSSVLPAAFSLHVQLQPSASQNLYPLDNYSRQLVQVPHESTTNVPAAQWQPRHPRQGPVSLARPSPHPQQPPPSAPHTFYPADTSGRPPPQVLYSNANASPAYQLDAPLHPSPRKRSRGRGYTIALNDDEVRPQED